MKRQRLSIFAVGFCAFVNGVCAEQPTAATSTNNVGWQVIELPQRTLTLRPTRDDITVGCVILSMSQSDMGKALPLDAIRVNGRQSKGERLYLKQVGKNQFEFPALKIEFSSQALGSPLYLTLKAWFNELTNQEDSPYYDSEHLKDRYALLSYCSKEDDDPSKLNARLGANRMKTLKEFEEALARPIVIRLNQRPLRPGLGKWPMINGAPGELSEADLKTIQQLVRDRGERYLIAISTDGRGAVFVGVGDHNLFESTRQYELERAEGTWRIKKVETREGG